MNPKLTKLDVASWCGFIILAASMMITPLCLPEIAESLNTSFTEGGALETARTAIVLVILLLAGIWAGRWGKKLFLTIGQYTLACGLLLTSFASSYPVMVFSLMITGIGAGFSESLLNPLVADLHPRDTGKYLNLTNAFFSIGVLLASLIFGELLTRGLSWRWVFRITAVFALFTGIFMNVLRFPAREQEKESSRKIIGSIVKQPVFWLFAAAMFLGGGVEAAFTFWSRSYIALYLESLPRAGAAAVMLFAGTMAGGRLLSARLARRISLKAIMICSSILGMVVSFVIPFAGNLVFLYILIGLAGLATACLWPSILADAGHALRMHSTILFVLLACVGAGGFGLVPLVMGIIGDTQGLQSSFYILPVLFLLLIAVLVIAWLYRKADPE